MLLRQDFQHFTELCIRQNVLFVSANRNQPVSPETVNFLPAHQPDDLSQLMIIPLMPSKCCHCLNTGLAEMPQSLAGAVKAALPADAEYISTLAETATHRRPSATL